MIRPATDALREHVGGVTLTVILLAAAWVTVGAAVFVSSSLDRISRAWMEDFRPVIYLEAGAGSAAAESVSKRVGGWDEVEEVTVRSPRDAYREAASRVGEERLSSAGAKPGMFPYSVVVRPAGAFGGVDLAARLEALETREQVEAVDVPSEGVRGVLGSARRLLYGFSIPLFVLVAAALAQVGSFLRKLQRTEHRELFLLERFGAGRWELARATIYRGALLGLWAGLGATGILLVMALYWRTIETSILGGVPPATPWNWWVVAAPLLTSPIGGGAVGIWVAHPGLGSDTDGSRAVLPSIKPLLDYG